MKIKSVLAAVAAAAVLATGSAVAFAETNEEENAPVVTADETPVESTDDSDADSTDSTDGTDNAETGVEGVAAVVGVLTLAGAAVVISRKRS